jgi:hypothetical protein
MDSRQIRLHCACDRHPPDSRRTEYPADQSVTSLERRERIINGWGAACAADADVTNNKKEN